MNGTDDWADYRAQTAAMRVEVGAYPAKMVAKLARYEVARLELLAADHDAALAEDQEYEETRAARRRAEYSAYLCSMSDHGCACLALGFDDWLRTTAQVTA